MLLRMCVDTVHLGNRGFWLPEGWRVFLERGVGVGEGRLEGRSSPRFCPDTARWKHGGAALTACPGRAGRRSCW